VALARGPLVYCLESVDNPFPLAGVRVAPDAVFSAEFRPDLLGGVTVLKARAKVADAGDWNGTLYRTTAPQYRDAEITAIPYYAWDNREPGEMLVWLPVEGGS
jgi:DUF1680 family protein